MKKLLILFIAILATATYKTQAQTADEIIKKHLDAIGGVDNWRKLNTMKTTGTMNMQGKEIEIVVTVVENTGMRTDINIGGMANYQIITPTGGWVYFPIGGQTQPEAMTMDDIQKSIDILDLQGVLVDYQSKGHKVEYLGKDDVEGTECYKLKITHKSGVEEIYYIDASNYYHIRSVQKIKVNGQEQEVTLNYSNYQKLPEGIVYPMTMGSPQGDVTFKTVEINKPIDNSIFKPTDVKPSDAKTEAKQ